MGLLGALISAGCKKSDAGSNTGKPVGPDNTAHTALTGKVECNGEPVTFGYVVITDMPVKPDEQHPAPRSLHFDWSAISEDGSYCLAKAPVGHAEVLVITNPQEFQETVNGYVSISGRRGRTSQFVPRPHRRGVEEPLGASNPYYIKKSGKTPFPSTNPPNGSDVAPEPPSLPPDFSAPPPKFAAAKPKIEEAVENGQRLLEGLSAEIREKLEKINGKYARPGAIPQTISEGQKELDLHLTVD
jgi:hypothetical protein